MKTSDRIFVAAWEYPPLMSGESVICRRTLKNSRFNYDVCCGPVEAQGDKHVRLFPVFGNKYLWWPFGAACKFKELNKNEHYRAMMSRVMPPNGHLAGWLIKRQNPSIKWIAYFSDPIWNSPFLRRSLRDDGSHRPNWLLMKFFGIPSKWALREADLLVFNNERLARYVLGKRYGKLKERVVIAPYGHGDVKLRPPQQRNDGKYRVTHVGQIYGNRTLRSLVEGAELLQKEMPELFKRIELRQVGFVCEAEKERVKNSPAASAFTLIGQIPYEESVEEMYAADCLLVIDPEFDDPQKNIYIPGKIYDYISTGRPIVCIAHDDSATVDLAAAAGMPHVPHDGCAVYALLKSLLPEGLVVSRIRYSGFAVQEGVKCLDDALARLVGYKEESITAQ